MISGDYVKVYSLVKKIPKGRVSTYKIISLKTGLNPRLVGRVLSQNASLEKIPCFRVVCSNGFIGGYAGGVKEKKVRLESEGIEIKKFRITNFKEKLFFFTERSKRY